MHTCLILIYNETCLQRPPLGQTNQDHCTQVVLFMDGKVGLEGWLLLTNFCSRQVVIATSSTVHSEFRILFINYFLS